MGKNILYDGIEMKQWLLKFFLNPTRYVFGTMERELFSYVEYFEDEFHESDILEIVTTYSIHIFYHLAN